MRGKIAVIIASWIAIAACGGTTSEIQNGTRELSSANSCTLEGDLYRCDVNACEADCTLFADFPTGADIPLAECPTEGEASVSFAINLPGEFDIVCRSGDSGVSILLAHHRKHQDENIASGDTPIEPAGSNADGVITPAVDQNTDLDKDHDGVSDAQDHCPDLYGWVSGCPQTLTPIPFQQIPIGMIGVINPALEAQVSATRDPQYFGVTRVSWSVGISESDISEMYLWSAGDFNRAKTDGQTNAGNYDLAQACGVIDEKDENGHLVTRRQLIVPADRPEEWFNDNSAEAKDVEELLTGQGCDNEDNTQTNDCEGYQNQGIIACRMDLRKSTHWRTSGEITTIAGHSGQRNYVLVIKKKNGQTITKTASVDIPQASAKAANGGFLVSFDDTLADGLAAKVRFDYAGIPIRSRILVEAATDGGAFETCYHGQVNVPQSGNGSILSQCLLGDKTQIRVIIPGLSVMSYVIELGNTSFVLGKPFMGNNASMAPTTISGPTTTAFGVELTRTWSLLGKENFEDGQYRDFQVNGQLSPDQTLRSLKAHNLYCYSFAKRDFETCGLANSGAWINGLTFTNVPLNHDNSQYKVTVTTQGGATQESGIFGFLIVTNFEKGSSGLPSYMTAQAVNPISCGFTGDPFAYTGLTQDFMIQTQHTKAISWTCGAGTNIVVKDGDQVIQPGYQPADPYHVTTLTAHVTSPATKVYCNFTLETYYYDERFDNSAHYEMETDSCETTVVHN